MDFEGPEGYLSYLENYENGKVGVPKDSAEYQDLLKQQKECEWFIVHPFYWTNSAGTRLKNGNFLKSYMMRAHQSLLNGETIHNLIFGKQEVV